MCCAVGGASRPLSTADETAHFDYAYQVWHGQLPVFEHGVLFRPPAPTPIPPVQWESQHPPLFYVLASPLVGPLTDHGHWMRATLLVRLLNCVLSALAVLAIAWGTGNAVRGPNRRRTMLMSAAAATTIGGIVFVGGTAFSDPLLTLTSAAAVGIGLWALRDGASARITRWACLVAAIGAMARAEFVLALFVMAFALSLAVWLQSRDATVGRARRSVVAGLLPLLSAAVFGGWFFVRNKITVGNFSGGHPGWAVTHLPETETRSLFEVLTFHRFWNTQVSLIRHPLDGRYLVNHVRDVVDSWVMVLVFIAALVLGVRAAIASVRRARRRRDEVTLAAAVVVAGLLVLTFLFEIEYSRGGGGSITRYLLPAALSLSMLIAGALQSAPVRWQPRVLLAYLAVSYGLFGYWLVLQPHSGGVFGTAPSKLPWILVLLTLPVLAGCALAQVRAISRVDTSTGTDELLPRADPGPPHALALSGER